MGPGLHKEGEWCNSTSIVEDISDQIGERLKSARERIGLTVDDVIFRTRIPRSVVVALESADFAAFSSPVYAKSFLSQYSGFLNVDAHPWVDALEPASFISGDLEMPVWEAASAIKEEKISSATEASGWISALSLLVLSCALVYAAIKGYEYFDANFAANLSVPPRKEKEEEKVQPQQAPREVSHEMSQETALRPRTWQEKQEDELAQPPPRAIIVR